MDICCHLSKHDLTCLRLFCTAGCTLRGGISFHWHSCFLTSDSRRPCGNGWQSSHGSLPKGLLKGHVLNVLPNLAG